MKVCKTWVRVNASSKNLNSAEMEKKKKKTF